MSFEEEELGSAPPAGKTIFQAEAKSQNMTII